MRFMAMSAYVWIQVNRLNMWLFEICSAAHIHSSLEAALITATWQAPTVPSIQSHTSLKSTQLASVGVRVLHSASPEYRSLGYDSSDSREEGVDTLTQKKLILSPAFKERCRSKSWDFPADWLTYLFICPSVILCCSVCPRDDNFSDTLSQKADSEASSGHTGEDKCSGKDVSSPTDSRMSEAYISRLVFKAGAY